MTSASRHEVREAFAGLFSGTIEADRLNRLIIAANLDRRQVAVLRTYLQLSPPGGYLVQPLVRGAGRRPPAELAGVLARLFDDRFDPGASIDDEVESRSGGRRCAHEAIAMLDDIPSLDDDRICRAVLTLIDATLRTNAFQPRRQTARSPRRSR